MPKGGYRPTAGRPRGARDKAPRKRKAPPPDAAAEKAFLEACADFVESGEPFRILSDMAKDPDPRVRGWAVDKLLSYGVGLPGRRPEPAPTDFGSLVREGRLRAREPLEEAMRLLENARARRLRKAENDPAAPAATPKALISEGTAPAPASTASEEPPRPSVSSHESDSAQAASGGLERPDRPSSGSVGSGPPPPEIKPQVDVDAWPEVTRRLVILKEKRK